MVLDVCVKFEVQQKYDSPDTGPRVTPKRLFRLFLDNLTLDFVNFTVRMGLLWYSMCVYSMEYRKNLVLQIWGQ